MRESNILLSLYIIHENHNLKVYLGIGAWHTDHKEWTAQLCSSHTRLPSCWVPLLQHGSPCFIHPQLHPKIIRKHFLHTYNNHWVLTLQSHEITSWFTVIFWALLHLGWQWLLQVLALPTAQLAGQGGLAAQAEWATTKALLRVTHFNIQVVFPVWMQA